MKFLLIDGNNMAVRAAFSQDDLVNSRGVHTGSHYGSINSLFYLREQFPEHIPLVAWDGKSKFRMTLSESGVTKKVIPSTYKANRKKDEIPLPLAHFHEQSDYIKHGIDTLGIPQIYLPDHEADDVIASYCEQLKDAEEVVLVTSDKDYYQLIRENIWIWDAMKAQKTDLQAFRDEWGIDPEQWVDVGALAGDTGDNIFGLPGWGDTTAVKEIREYHDYEGVIRAYEDKYAKLREKHPDLHEREGEWQNVFEKEIKQALTGKGENTLPENRTDNCYKYPRSYWGIPWSGVALAVERKEAKIPKKKLICLMYQDRVRLAYQLKAMKRDISFLPEIPQFKVDKKRFSEYIAYFEMPTLQERLDTVKQILEQETG